MFSDELANWQSSHFLIVFPLTAQALNNCLRFYFMLIVSSLFHFSQWFRRIVVLILNAINLNLQKYVSASFIHSLITLYQSPHWECALELDTEFLERGSSFANAVTLPLLISRKHFWNVILRYCLQIQLTDGLGTDCYLKL